uniref:Uncharacterized protein n=1 Tax=Cucumis sativus TaxID=3659 RepID=A0A0A0K847_CUCSA
MLIIPVNIRIPASIQLNWRLASARALISASSEAQMTAPSISSLPLSITLILQPLGTKFGTHSMNPMFINQHPCKTTNNERIRAAGKLLGQQAATITDTRDANTITCKSQW